MEIERNRHMSELVETPQRNHNYCSVMPDKEMINRYIEYLINQSELKDLQIRSLEIKIDEQRRLPHFLQISKRKVIE